MTRGCVAAMALVLAAAGVARTRAAQPLPASTRASVPGPLPERLPDRLSDTGLYLPGSVTVICWRSAFFSLMSIP